MSYTLYAAPDGHDATAEANNSKRPFTLVNAVRNAKAGQTVRLLDGEYDIGEAVLDLPHDVNLRADGMPAIKSWSTLTAHGCPCVPGSRSLIDGIKWILMKRDTAFTAAIGTRHTAGMTQKWFTDATVRNCQFVAGSDAIFVKHDPNAGIIKLRIEDSVAEANYDGFAFLNQHIESEILRCTIISRGPPKFKPIAVCSAINNYGKTTVIQCSLKATGGFTNGAAPANYGIRTQGQGQSSYMETKFDVTGNDPLNFSPGTFEYRRQPAI